MSLLFLPVFTSIARAIIWLKSWLWTEVMNGSVMITAILFPSRAWA
ncbi:MAG: hypothetical protein LUQ32_02145 [Methanomicrobiales archaeon]|nr:hypothetical protein [Methanomicrobiales archaeon]